VNVARPIPPASVLVMVLVLVLVLVPPPVQLPRSMSMSDPTPRPSRLTRCQITRFLHATENTVHSFMTQLTSGA